MKGSKTGWRALLPPVGYRKSCCSKVVEASANSAWHCGSRNASVASAPQRYGQDVGKCFGQHTAQPCGHLRFFNTDGAAGLTDAGNHRLYIERLDRWNVDNLGVDAVTRKNPGSDQAFVSHHAGPE